MKNVKIALLPGDGIGPEVVAEARAVLALGAERGGISVEWSEGVVGGAAIDAEGTALPATSFRVAQESDAVLLGAVGGPKWDDPQSKVRPEQALLGLRKGLGLFANLRPVRTYTPLVGSTALDPAVIDGTDMMVVRELTGGIYFGQPSERRVGTNGREAVDTLFYNEEEVARVTRLAFTLARGRRKKVTSVDKANILSTSRLWREVAHEVAREFPEVRCEDLLVDAMAMHLIRRPRDFDVVVTENMFGDILTDEASLLAGSLGMLPSASLGAARNSLGHTFGLYEPVHGSAPDIAGRDIANPLGTILSVAMLFRFSLGDEATARAIEFAVSAVLEEGLRTADIAQEGRRTIGCHAMGEAVRGHLASCVPGQ